MSDAPSLSGSPSARASGVPPAWAQADLLGRSIFARMNAPGLLMSRGWIGTGRSIGDSALLRTAEFNSGLSVGGALRRVPAVDGYVGRALIFRAAAAVGGRSAQRRRGSGAGSGDVSSVLRAGGTIDTVGTAKDTTGVSGIGSFGTYGKLSVIGPAGAVGTSNTAVIDPTAAQSIAPIESYIARSADPRATPSADSTTAACTYPAAAPADGRLVLAAAGHESREPSMPLAAPHSASNRGDKSDAGREGRASANDVRSGHDSGAHPLPLSAADVIARQPGAPAVRQGDAPPSANAMPIGRPASSASAMPTTLGVPVAGTMSIARATRADVPAPTGGVTRAARLTPAAEGLPSRLQPPPNTSLQSTPDASAQANANLQPSSSLLPVGSGILQAVRSASQEATRNAGVPMVNRIVQRAGMGASGARSRGGSGNLSGYTGHPNGPGNSTGGARSGDTAGDSSGGVGPDGCVGPDGGARSSGTAAGRGVAYSAIASNGGTYLRAGSYLNRAAHHGIGQHNASTLSLSRATIGHGVAKSANASAQGHDIGGSTMPLLQPSSLAQSRSGVSQPMPLPGAKPLGSDYGGRQMAAGETDRFASDETDPSVSGETYHSGTGRSPTEVATYSSNYGANGNPVARQPVEIVHRKTAVATSRTSLDLGESRTSRESDPQPRQPTQSTDAAVPGRAPTNAAMSGPAFTVAPVPGQASRQGAMPVRMSRKGAGPEQTSATAAVPGHASANPAILEQSSAGNVAGASKVADASNAATASPISDHPIARTAMSAPQARAALPVAQQLAADTEAAAFKQTEHPGQPPASQQQPNDIDIDAIVDKAFREVLSRLSIERERRGFTRWA